MNQPRAREQSGEDLVAADRFWHEALQRAAHAPDTPLALFERELAKTDSPDLSSAEIDAIVEAALGSASTSAHGARDPAPSRWNSRGVRVAAILLLSLMSTAAVVVPLLLWPEQRDSANSMSFSVSLELLRHPDEPLNSRSSALGRMFGRVREVIRTLQSVKGDPASPPDLRAAAELSIRDLSALLSDPSRAAPDSAPTDVELRLCLAAVAEGSLDPQLRSQAAHLVGRYAAIGVWAIREAGTTMPDLSAEQAIVVRSLIRLLSE